MADTQKVWLQDEWAVEKIRVGSLVGWSQNAGEGTCGVTDWPRSMRKNGTAIVLC